MDNGYLNWATTTVPFKNTGCFKKNRGDQSGLAESVHAKYN